MAGKKGPALRRPLALYLLQSLGNTGIQVAIIQLIQQGAVKCTLHAVRLGQAPAVEDRVAFPPFLYQSALGQYLQVVAHAGLFHGHDVAQLQHPEAVLAQHLQHLQT